MRSSLATDLASMPEDDFAELVWENGQILMRGRSGTSTQKGPSCSTACSVYPSNAEAESEALPRLETVCSISNDSTFSGFMGRPSSNSLPELYRFNLEGSKRKSNDKQHPRDSQIVVEHDRARSTRGIPELGSSKNSTQLDPSDSLIIRSSETQVSMSALHTSRLLQDQHERRPATASLGGSKPTVSVSKSASALQNQLPVGKIKESVPVPDDPPEAFGRRNHRSGNQQANTAAGKPKFTEPAVESSSVRSLGASNDPTYSFKRTYEDTDQESAYLSEDFTRKKVEEPHQGAKRSRTAHEQVHNLSERRRRDKFNKKMRALKELIPNCNKVDNASMLDEAIEYLKTLQLQLQIMSMGSSPYCIPPMMFPTMMQHMMTAPHLTLFSPMGMGMGMGCNPATRFQMLGFPGQAFPMSVSHAPFIPLVGMPSTQSLVAAAPLGEHLGSTPLTTSKDSNQK